MVKVMFTTNMSKVDGKGLRIKLCVLCRTIGAQPAVRGGTLDRQPTLDITIFARKPSPLLLDIPVLGNQIVIPQAR